MKKLFTLFYLLPILISPVFAQNNALPFNGTDDYVQVPYNAAINPANFTLEAWVIKKSGGSEYQSVITSRESGPNHGYVIYAHNNNWEFWAGYGSQDSWDVVTGAAIQTDKWTHLAATYDGTTMRFYVDGVLSGTLPVNNFVPNASKPLRIGAGKTEDATPDFYFTGTVDEVRVWNTARTVS